MKEDFQDPDIDNSKNCMFLRSFLNNFHRLLEKMDQKDCPLVAAYNDLPLDERDRMARIAVELWVNDVLSYGIRLHKIEYTLSQIVEKLREKPEIKILKDYEGGRL